MSQKLNALSVDLEDWFHPELVRRFAPQPCQRQVCAATRPLLELLDRYDTKCTFFVLGDVARENPELVSEIHAGGHEIAFHGMSHRPLWDMDEVGFRREIDSFKQIINSHLGAVEVKGFRAPTFSLDSRTRWALRVLADSGYEYDSSIFPVRNGLYGVPNAPIHPYRPSLRNVHETDMNNRLVEFPMTVLSIGKVRIPVAGGFYLRLFPLRFLIAAFRKVNETDPAIVYLHPWEAYPGTPRLPLSARSRFITYYGTGRVLGKLEALLQHFKFSRVDEVLANERC